MASIPYASFQAMNMHKHLHQQIRVRHISESSACSEISEDSSGVETPTSYAPSRRVSIADPTKMGDKSLFGNFNNVKDRTWQWICSGGSTVYGNTIYEKEFSEKSKDGVTKQQ